MNNKNSIPGTKPEWNRNLPDGDLNSIVDSNGENYDNKYNFDERDDDDEHDEGFQSLTKMEPFEKRTENLNTKNAKLENSSDKLS